jgi:hypothetical protein
MEVKIGVVYSPRELSVEVEGDADSLVSEVESAMRDGVPVLWFTDRKGKRVGVPVDKIAYVEIGEDDAAKRVGFGPG